MNSKPVTVFVSTAVGLALSATNVFGQFTDPFTPEDIPRNLPLYLFVGAVLGLPISGVVLWLYRRAVIRLMKGGAEDRCLGKISFITAESPKVARHTPKKSAGKGPISRKAAARSAEALSADSIRRSWHCAFVYALGGFCFSLSKAFIDIHSSYTSLDLMISEFPQNRILASIVLALIYVWPVIFTTSLIAARSWTSRLIIGIGYLGITFGTWIVSTVPLDAIFLYSLKQDAPDFLQKWIVSVTPGFLLLALFLNRGVRAIGVLVMFFVAVAFTGISVAYAVIDVIRTNGFWLGSAAENGILVTSLLSLGLAGWVTLRWVRARYKRKKLNDQSLTIDAIWLFLAIGDFFLVIYGTPPRILSGLVAFLAYKLVVGGLIKVYRGDDLGTGVQPALLVLRVFSLGKRSVKLFDSLASRWRYFGPIKMIAGPDLATTTIEPGDLLDFITGRLSGRFIGSSEGIKNGLQELDLSPDEDGRFRVNEFFCNERTWRIVLSRLVESSDVTFMDLRGFTEKNAGCLQELKELAMRGFLEQLVIAVDETTDEKFLWDSVEGFLEEKHLGPLSVNAQTVPFKVYKMSGSLDRDVSELTRLLFDAALVTKA